MYGGSFSSELVEGNLSSNSGSHKKNAAVIRFHVCVGVHIFPFCFPEEIDEGSAFSTSSLALAAPF